MAICPLSTLSRSVKACKGKILQKALSPSSFDIAVLSCNAPVCALLGVLARGWCKLSGAVTAVSLATQPRSRKVDESRAGVRVPYQL